jgi:hypothetical protein
MRRFGFALTGLAISGGLFFLGGGLLWSAAAGAAAGWQWHRAAEVDETPLDDPKANTAEAQRAFASSLLAAAAAKGTKPPQVLALAERAAGALRRDLAAAPGDGIAWAMLAEAEAMQEHRAKAAEALKASIIAAPWVTQLPLWRCVMGVHVFAELDDETRTLLEGQFRIAAQRDAFQLARAVHSAEGIKIARAMLASSPDELEAYTEQLSK